MTAVELIIVIVVVGIAAAVTLPALLRGSRNDKLVICEARLRALGEADTAFRAREGKSPAGRGAAYWKESLGPDGSRLACPLSDQHLPYRGPASDPTPFPATYPLAADQPGSHGPGEGGNVLLKSGEIRACRELDPLWRLAAERLAP